MSRRPPPSAAAAATSLRPASRGRRRSSSSSQRDGSVLHRQAAEKDERARDLEEKLLAVAKQASAGPAAAVGGVSAAAVETSKSLRVQICELLADVILLSPSCAARRSAPDRLWRKCFYAEIARVRSKLSRCREKGGAGAGAGGTTTASNNDNKNKIARLERHLLVYLSEAVTLYEFLVDKLREKLRAAVDAGEARKKRKNKEAAAGGAGGDELDDDDGSCNHFEEDDVASRNEDAEATVECLHQLYVCLGDLHRYSSSANATTTTTATNSALSFNRSAERSYLLSAKLAPGIGHPANQLGVLCGYRLMSAAASSSASSSSSSSFAAPNQSAVGLYWYARALLASREPSYETTASNMNKLFQANQRWLDGAVAAATEPTTTTSKSLQSSLFLAKFVRLHGLLLADAGGGDNGNALGVAGDDDSFESTVVEDVRSGLEALLKQSALSDSLLTKLVAILAFSETYIPTGSSHPRPPSIPATVSLVPGADGGTVPPASACPPQKMRSQQLGRIVTLLVGIQVSDRIVAFLEQKKPAGASIPNIRLLLPLLLLAEYVRASSPRYPPASAAAAAPLARPSNDLSKNPTSSISPFEHRSRRIDELSHALWDKIANVLNLLEGLYPAFDSVNGRAANSSVPSFLSPALPNEYLALRGYVPFARFIPEGTRNGFLSPQDALEALAEEKELDSPTQDGLSASTSAGTTGVQPTHSHPHNAGALSTGAASGAGTQDSAGGTNQESNRLKIVRFLRFGNELAKDCTAPSLRGLNRADDGRFVYDARKMRDEPDPSPVPMDMDLSCDDGGDDVTMGFEGESELQKGEPNGQESSNVLVYKQGKAGGPALLVPAALLQPQQPNNRSASSMIPLHPTTVAADPKVSPPIATGVNLGSLHDQNSIPSTGVADFAKLEMKPTLVGHSMDSHFSTERETPGSRPSEADLRHLSAVAQSAATAPSGHDVSPAAVLPPPGFGSLVAAVPNAVLQPQFLEKGPPTAHAAPTFLGAPVGYGANPIPSITLLETPSFLFGPPGAVKTRNPFVPSHYHLPPSGLAEAFPTTFGGPTPSGDELWMEDMLGGDDYEGTSLLDSGLLNSMLNDGTSPQKTAPTKNPFAT